jgi:hypothetical protein
LTNDTTDGEEKEVRWKFVEAFLDPHDPLFLMLKDAVSISIFATFVYIIEMDGFNRSRI